MKLTCTCNHPIIDNTDGLSHKGYVISDTHWNNFWDAIDKAIEESGPSPEDKERACMSVRQTRPFRSIWECTHCGRLWMDSPAGKLVAYAPGNGTYNRVLGNK